MYSKISTNLPVTKLRPVLFPSMHITDLSSEPPPRQSMATPQFFPFIIVSATYHVVVPMIAPETVGCIPIKESAESPGFTV